MAKLTYLVAVDGNGTEVTSVKEVGVLLGTTVKKADILAGLVEGVVVLEDGVFKQGHLSSDDIEEVEDTEVLEDAVEEVEDTEEVVEDDTAEDEVASTDVEEDEVPTDEVPEADRLQALMAQLKKPEPTAKAPKVKQDLADTEVEYPEQGHFSTDNELKKFVKRLSDAQLQEWIELESLEYKANDNPGINRMRMAMAIKELHFPTEKKATKSKSKYGHISTEELLELALANDVEVKDAKGNMQILRMYTIMALKGAGLLE